MGSQSAVMMKMAGEQWQYGKRRISAMTNEEFNKMTPQKLFEIETAELRAMIPLMQESMRDMNKLTPIIVQEMIQMFKDFINEIYKTIQTDTDSYLHPFFNFLLEQFGLPTKNIDKDFDNDPGKFLPPKDVPDPTFPPKTTPPPPPPPVKPPEDILKDTDKAAAALVWQKFVGPGKNLTQVKSAIKVFEANIFKIQKLINDFERSTAYKSGENRQSQANRIALVKVWTTAMNHWKSALAYLSKKGSGATTP